MDIIAEAVKRPNKMLSEEARKRKRDSDRARDPTTVNLELALAVVIARGKTDKRCQADLLTFVLSNWLNNLIACYDLVVLCLRDVWLCKQSC